ncbi:MAG: hypothetical protein FD147_2575 [Chloroflexi bacterium]|nr:MAG: hypothetical protein FD147_2575 [Chloroflexota bacterium]
MYNKTMEESSDIERKIAEIESEQSNLAHRRSQLLDELAHGIASKNPQLN